VNSFTKSMNRMSRSYSFEVIRARIPTPVKHNNGDFE